MLHPLPHRCRRSHGVATFVGSLHCVGPPCRDEELRSACRRQGVHERRACARRQPGRPALVSRRTSLGPLSRTPTGDSSRSARCTVRTEMNVHCSSASAFLTARGGSICTGARPRIVLEIDGNCAGSQDAIVGVRRPPGTGRASCPRVPLVRSGSVQFLACGSAWRSAGTCVARPAAVAAAWSCAEAVSSRTSAQRSARMDARSCSSAHAGSRQGTRLPIA